ncbi:LOW QUALITY PROTEIN: hypothetical protein U9M48_026761 [Paspalum notatum var. saurae]|uniref:Glucan endo-1,3-beta-D-glucosidase n=1 Tax=Paspalum notatum var. saurae TaxID=547442 RepID=A0AAQ3WZ67_PASNO
MDADTQWLTVTLGPRRRNRRRSHLFEVLYPKSKLPIAWVAAHLPASIVSSRPRRLRGQRGPLRRRVARLYDALPPNSSVKVSTVNGMDVLASSDPPSSGAFKPELATALDPVLAFLSKTGSPFLINPYPYFAYQSDPRPETLAFCLFQPNAGRPDAGSGGVRPHLHQHVRRPGGRRARRAGRQGDVEIVVAETGWPHKGDADEAGATVENARAFVSGLVSHLQSLAGTPRVPGKSVDTYIFTLYDEDLKPGKASERYFGLFQTSLTETYPTGLLSNGTAGLGPAMAPTTLVKPATAPSLMPTTPVQPGSAEAAGPSALCAPGTARAREELTACALIRTLLNRLALWVMAGGGHGPWPRFAAASQAVLCTHAGSRPATNAAIGIGADVICREITICSFPIPVSCHGQPLKSNERGNSPTQPDLLNACLVISVGRYDPILTSFRVYPMNSY